MHLGVARANALQAKTSQGADADAARVRALAAYKDFLALWKDADPDIPILKQAKTEYAKLHNGQGDKSLRSRFDFEPLLVVSKSRWEGERLRRGEIHANP